MNKKKISTILLASVLLSSCSILPSNETVTEAETSITAAEETSSESSEDTSAATQVSSYPAADDADDMFRYLNAGDTFSFGEYDGEEMEWLVLSISGYTCYCITADNIDYMPLNETGAMNDWNSTSMSRWLNDEFYEESFTDEEKVRIRYAVGTESPVIDTENKIYLLNRFDAERYADILADHPAHDDWWLRSRSNGSRAHADICTADGVLDQDGGEIDADHGVRPVMKLYIGTDEDTLDLANLTPTPIPSPTPSPTPTPTPVPGAIVYPEHETVMPPLPDEVPYDGNLSEEANLENYYTNNIQGLYGTAAASSVSVETSTYNDFSNSWLDINGALSHVIADFDGDGDLEMIAFIFVTELDDEDIENTETYYYHLHLLLCDDVDGTVRIIDDLPVMTRWTNPDGTMSNRFDGYHCGIYSDMYFTMDIGLYAIAKDGKTYILMTDTVNANPVGDGFTEAAYVWEVSGDRILYSSSYCACQGSDNTCAVEITYENGEPVSSEWYYMYPDDYGVPGNYQGIHLYIERQGLSCEDRTDGRGMDITDPFASAIVRCGVDWESLEVQYNQPFLFTYYVE